MFPWYLQFSWRDLYSFPFYCFSLLLCVVHLRKLSYCSLLFFETLHSVGYIFTFLFCLLLLFFSEIFVRSPQTTILPSLISFLWDGFGHCFLYNVMNLCPESLNFKSWYSVWWWCYCLSCVWFFVIAWSVTFARLLCSWKSSGKNIGMDSHSVLQGIFMIQG